MKYGMDTTCANLFNNGSEWKRPDSFCLISGCHLSVLCWFSPLYITPYASLV